MFGRHLLAVLLAAAPTLLAQQQASQAVQAQQQSSISQQTQGGLVRGAAAEALVPASASDSDIGEQEVLQSSQKYQPFSAWTNWNVFWTSNAPLLQSSNRTGSDTFLSGTVGAGYMPGFGGGLFGDFSAEQSLFRYARNASLDFNSLELKAGLVYVLHDLGDLALYGHYTYDLLTARGFNSEIYSDHALSIGARKAFSLGRAQLLYASGEAQCSLGGEPSYALENVFSLTAGYQASLTRMVRLDLAYSVAAQDYTSSSRADFNQLLTGGLTFEFTRWLSVQALSTIAINRSTDSTYNYFAANLGGGLGILVNF